MREPSLLELSDAMLEEGGVTPSDEARRPVLETLALFAYGLDEVEPARHVKERLMAEVARERPQGSAPARMQSLVDHPPRPAAGDREAPSPVSIATPQANWMLPIAAALLLAVATFALFQASQVRAQREALVRFEGQIESVEDQLAVLRSDRDQARTQLAAVSLPGTEVCALMPRAEGAPEDAHGTLVMMPGGEGWVLSLAGLDDVPGKTYQMWFLGEETATSAGTFETGNRPYTWAHDQMPPPGTRAVTVTLEPEGGAPSPTGPEMLFGDAEDMISFL